MSSNTMHKSEWLPLSNRYSGGFSLNLGTKLGKKFLMVFKWFTYDLWRRIFEGRSLDREKWSQAPWPMIILKRIWSRCFFESGFFLSFRYSSLLADELWLTHSPFIVFLFKGLNFYHNAPTTSSPDHLESSLDCPGPGLQDYVSSRSVQFGRNFRPRTEIFPTSLFIRYDLGSNVETI